MLSRIELTIHQLQTGLMSDWSMRQSREEVTSRKILRSSAKIRELQYLIESNKSLMKTLKRKGPRTEPWGTPEINLKGWEKLTYRRTQQCLEVK
jgi:hypothetical protein